MFRPVLNRPGCWHLEFVVPFLRKMIVNFGVIAYIRRAPDGLEGLVAEW